MGRVKPLPSPRRKAKRGAGFRGFIPHFRGEGPKEVQKPLKPSSGAAFGQVGRATPWLALGGKLVGLEASIVDTTLPNIL